MAARHRLAAAQERAAFEGALRVAFGRMAADCPGLDGMVKSIEIQELGLAEMIDLAETGMFLAVLEGRQDRMGLAMLCPSLLSGVIEAQATGRVEATPPPRRRPTRTDAALVARMIDAFLRLLENRSAELPQAERVSGYVYGSFLDDPRPLGLMLEDGLFLMLHLTVSLGTGAREGTWRLFLPMAEPVRAQPEADAAAAMRDWDARLEAAVRNSPVHLEAILCKLQLSLTEALRLRPGDILRLPDTALESLALESITHQPIGIGRLGQARGQRAVRLTAEPGILTDATGVSVSPVALPASVAWLRPPLAAFVPENAQTDASNRAAFTDSATKPMTEGDAAV
jgi:flagellar motor switch protein FliM